MVYFKIETVKNLILNKYIKIFIQKNNNKLNNFKKNVFIIHVNLAVYKQENN